MKKTRNTYKSYSRLYVYFSLSKTDMHLQHKHRQWLLQYRLCCFWGWRANVSHLTFTAGESPGGTCPGCQRTGVNVYGLMSYIPSADVFIVIWSNLLVLLAWDCFLYKRVLCLRLVMLYCDKGNTSLWRFINVGDQFCWSIYASIYKIKYMTNVY